MQREEEAGQHRAVNKWQMSGFKRGRKIKNQLKMCLQKLKTER